MRAVRGRVRASHPLGRGGRTRTRRVGLRCAGCGHERETTADLTATALFKAAHTNGIEQLAETAERLAHERMSMWVDGFAGALDRDLIDANDF